MVALHRGHLVAPARRGALGVTRPSVRLIEIRKEAVDRVGEGHRVGVEDDDILGARIHRLQGLGQRAALETLAAVAVQDLEAGLCGPALQDPDRFVGRVVDDDHLVLGVLEVRERGQQSLDDALLVVGGDVDRHERVIAEVYVVAVAVPVGVTVAVAVTASADAAEPRRVLAAAAVSVAVPLADREQRRQQHQEGAQVVLDRVREEDAAEEQAREGQRVGDRVARRVDMRLGEELDESAHHRDDRQHGQHEADDQERVQHCRPHQVVAPTTASQGPHHGPDQHQPKAGQAERQRQPFRGRSGREGVNQGARSREDTASGEAHSHDGSTHQIRIPSPLSCSAAASSDERSGGTRCVSGSAAASLEQVVVCNWGAEPTHH